MAKTGVGGIRRIVNAFFYSLKGFKVAFKYEAAVRQEFILALMLNALAFIISDTLATLLILLILPWITFTIEIINSAIEAVVDRIGDEYHELSGRAKDLGSAAVFVLLTLTSVSYLLAIFNYVTGYFNGS